MKSPFDFMGDPKRLEGLGAGAGQRKAQAPCSASTSVGGSNSEVAL
ncbi:hypothetical protein HP456_06170 [Bacillus haikouensis]|nr:hypothetical protein [Bacillus haikouensis]NQD65505.1 hypothetical protein [Bacillus haikouensis]